MNESAKIYIGKIDKNYLLEIQKGLLFIGLDTKIRTGDLIFIKPNLTFPYYKEGVMTSPRCIEQLIIALKDYTNKIMIGEADGGGYNRFPMDVVFDKTGLFEIAKKYDVKIINLSKQSSRNISFEHKRKTFVVPLPSILLDDVQLFITVPVPKVHANTGVSLSIKNQWGCIQNPALRLELHPFFKKVIYEINRALNVQVSVIDGKYGLNKNGPMRGDVTQLDWVMIADNIYAADTACCMLLGIDPDSIKHLRYYGQNEKKGKIEDFHFNIDPLEFRSRKFYLHREIWDYPGYLAFRSSFLAYLAYRSPLSRFLHNILYLFREKFY